MLERSIESPIREIPNAEDNRPDQNTHRLENPTQLKDEDESTETEEAFSPEDDAKLIELVEQKICTELWTNLGGKFRQKKDG